MNARERVNAFLEHREGDCVPVAPLMCGIGRTLTGVSYPVWSTDAEACADAFLATAEQFDIDCIVTLIDLSIECEAWGQKVIYPETEAAHPDYQDQQIRELEDYDKIQTIDFRTGKRMMMHLEVVKRLAEKLQGRIPVIAFVFGPLGTLSMMRGQEKMYLDLYDDPDAVRSATMRVAHTLADFAGALCDAGADGIMWDTLFASGAIMSKDMWRDMESDAAKLCAEAVQKRGKVNMIHNCGQKIYFDAQIESMNPAAFSFLYPPDDCADFAECKAKWGDKVGLIGCVPPTNVVIGTDEEWDALCREHIDLMAKGGGFMLAPGCEYPASAPLDRAQRMIGIARTYGQYK